jgi:hypothetical protein
MQYCEVKACENLFNQSEKSEVRLDWLVKGKKPQVWFSLGIWISVWHRVQSDRRAHSASYPFGTRDSIPGGKQSECEASTLPLSVIKNKPLQGNAGHVGMLQTTSSAHWQHATILLNEVLNITVNLGGKSDLKVSKAVPLPPCRRQGGEAI